MGALTPPSHRSLFIVYAFQWQCTIKGPHSLIGPRAHRALWGPFRLPEAAGGRRRAPGGRRSPPEAAGGPGAAGGSKVPPQPKRASCGNLILANSNSSLRTMDAIKIGKRGSQVGSPGWMQKLMIFTHFGEVACNYVSQFTRFWRHGCRS